MEWSSRHRRCRRLMVQWVYVLTIIQLIKYASLLRYMVWLSTLYLIFILSMLAKIKDKMALASTLSRMSGHGCCRQDNAVVRGSAARCAKWRHNASFVSSEGNSSLNLGPYFFLANRLLRRASTFGTSNWTYSSSSSSCPSFCISSRSSSLRSSSSSPRARPMTC